MLLFHNQFSAPGTSVELQGWEDEIHKEKHWVVIQYVVTQIILIHPLTFNVVETVISRVLHHLFKLHPFTRSH